MTLSSAMMPKAYCNHTEEQYLKVAYHLLKQLHKEMAMALVKYDNPHYNLLCMPYNTNERGMDAVFLPALAKICKGLVLTEIPTTRKHIHKEGNAKQIFENSGRIDYWCIYRNYSFVIELKHSFELFNGDSLRNASTIERWNTMVEQINSIKSDVKDYDEKTMGIIGLGIHLVSMYANTDKDIAVRRIKPNLTFERVQNAFATYNIKSIPQFQSLWVVPERIVKDDEDNFGQPTHALLMMAYINKYPTHRGGKFA